MTSSAKPNIMVYIPLIGGAPIIATELKRSSGRISVKDPAHVQMSPEQTHYVFSPIQFISEDHRVYESGLILDGPAAKHMRADYEAWVFEKNKGK